jgi:hypothetical protein
MYIPPGGFAGFSQMMPASRHALTKGSRSSGGRRRRTKKKKAKATRRASGKKRSGGKMKFGSPAWQKKYKVGKFAKKR